MRTRFLGVVAVVASCVGLSGTTQIAAQGQTAQPERACAMVRDYPAFHECAVEQMKLFEPPRTPDGKPDFNGIWRPTRVAQDIEEYTGRSGRTANTLIVDPPNGKIPYKPWAMTERFNN